MAIHGGDGSSEQQRLQAGKTSPRGQALSWSQKRALVGAWGRIVGRVALRRALPTYAALLVAAAIVFVGANAMHPSELTRALRSSWQGRCGGLLVWGVVSWPVARAVLLAPGLGFLRGLALPARAGVLAGGSWLFFVHAPWVLLWAAGAGPWAAVSVAAMSSALHAAWAGGLGRVPRRTSVRLGEALSIVSLGLAAACFGGPLAGSARSAALGTAASFVLALPALAAGLHRVVSEGGVLAVAPTRPLAPRGRAGTLRFVPRFVGRFVGRGPVLGWSIALVRVLLRGQSGVLLRWGWWSSAVISVAILTARNNGAAAAGAELSARGLLWAFAAGGGFVGGIGPASALARCERASAWWLEAAGFSDGRRLLSQGLALAPFAALLAVAQGLAFSSFVGGQELAHARAYASRLAAVLIAVLTTSSASLMALAASLAVRAGAEQGDRRDGGRLVVWALLGCAVEGVAGFRGGAGGVALGSLSLIVAAFVFSGGRERREVLVTSGRGEP